MGLIRSADVLVRFKEKALFVRCGRGGPRCYSLSNRLFEQGLDFFGYTKGVFSIDRSFECPSYFVMGRQRRSILRPGCLCDGSQKLSH